MVLSLGARRPGFKFPAEPYNVTFKDPMDKRKKIKRIIAVFLNLPDPINVNPYINMY